MAFHSFRKVIYADRSQQAAHRMADSAPPGSLPARTPEPAAEPTRWEGLHSAELPCETCGRPTRHRILRVSGNRRVENARIVEGLARCSQCRWTHSFALRISDILEVRAVVSDGERSRPTRIPLPADQRLLVGSRVPGREPPQRIVRIDLRTGGRGSDAVARDVATLWLTPDGLRPIPVSLVLGARTAATRAEVPPERWLEVGELIEVAGGRLRVTGLRAKNRTWSQPGDRFPAASVVRIYTRRIEMPPAGNSRWSRSREMSSSRTISRSRSDRSRSSPGVRTRRSRPRARSASGGADVHRASPS